MKQKFYTKVLQTQVGVEYDSSCFGRAKYSKVPCEREFDTLEEATEAAKKTVMATKDDVVIYKIAAVAKFPIEDIKVDVVA